MRDLKQAESGIPVPELCREHGMSNSSFYKWQARFGDIDASLMAELKDMVKQNRRLKRMYTEMSMQSDLLKEPLGKSVKAVFSTRDGHECSHAAGHQYRAGLSYLPNQ